MDLSSESDSIVTVDMLNQQDSDSRLSEVNDDFDS
jgi:hypothetical protein